MLLGDMNVSTFDASLDVAPKPFSGINMMGSIDVLFMPVIANPVLKTFLRKNVVGLEFVGFNQASPLNVFFNNRDEGFSFNIRNNVRHDIPTTLNHSKNDSLTFCTTPTLAGMLPTNKGFIGFDLARKFVIPINLCHIFADFMRHSPSGFISQGKLSLKFLGRNTMPGSGKEVHSVKPLLKGSVGVLKRSANHWVNMIAAPLTAISRDACKFVKLAFLLTARALSGISKTNLHKVFQAGIIVWKGFEELLNRHYFIHGFYLHE